MTLPRSLAKAIADAVDAEGGDAQDARGLAATWERLQADQHGRLDRLRYDAAHPRCCCVDGRLLEDAGRCGRCYGAVPA